jgi:hypothetical protein
MQNNYLELEVGPFQALSIDTGAFGTFSLGVFLVRAHPLKIDALDSCDPLDIS